MAHPQPFDGAGLEAELQDYIREDAATIAHALFCTQCDARDVALHALALAGWTELEFLEDSARRRGERD